MRVARKKTSSTAPATRRGKPRARRGKARPGLLRRVRRLLLRLVLIGVVAALAAVAVFAIFDPPVTRTMAAEKRRLGSIEHAWVPLDEVSPAMRRAAVAAEDANFCLHWGFDVAAIRAALDAGAQRGASTITQQTVKNVYLWQGRSWTRKALEALLTPLVEAVWSKHRILEVYLNVAEFGEGVFGVRAAALAFFRVPAADLSPDQAALLAAVLPSPRTRSVTRPDAATRRRAAQIAHGAETIRLDGRADCFGAGAP